MKVITDFPIGAFLICLSIGLFLSVLLYWKSNKKKEISKKILWVLFGLHFFSVFFLSLLLFSPYIKRNVTQIEKPIIVVAQDNTASILLSGDSLSSSSYPKNLRKLVKNLENSYQVQTYSFSNKIDQKELVFDYQGKETDIAFVLNEIRDQYVNRNIGAVVLASDGIYNYGSNPLNYTDLYPFPLYTIALGDTSVKKDIKVSHCLYNKITYLGNTFPLQFTISGDMYKGKKTRVKVSSEGKEWLFDKEIKFTSDKFQQTETVTIEAKKIGLQRYTIEVTPLEGEITYENNKQSVFIEVLDKRQRIALLSEIPHPDISAIKQIVEHYEHYDLKTSLLDDFNEPIQNYNLLIALQLPFSGGQGVEIIQSAIENKVPVLFVLGAQTNIRAFNMLNTGMTISSNIYKFTENQASINSSFPLFTLDENIRTKIDHFPPLLSPFGSYQLSPRMQTLAYAKIGSVTTQQPLISFIEGEYNRMGFICGEGIWKWRLADFSQNESSENINALISKVIQYVSSTVNKNRFVINHKPIFKENEPVIFEGEFYNENYEPITTPEISMIIYGIEGKSSEYDVNKTEGGYRLNIGMLNPGNYRYKAATSFGAKDFSLQGEFVVEEIRTEEMNLVADHALLYSLSQKTGGEMFFPNQLDELEKTLTERDDIKPVIYYHSEYTEMLTMLWVFLLIVLLFSIHWFLRKYNGFV